MTTRIGWKTGLMAGWMAATTVAVVVLAVDRATVASRPASFETLNVQRLNVLEPDGKPRLILANRKHFPGVIWDGKEYRHFNRDAGGMLFFNNDGTEAGGLITDNNRGKSGGHMANLSFDQFESDETVSLNYTQQGTDRSAGLQIHDRPDASLLPVIRLSDRYAGAKTDAERAAIRKEMEKVLVANGGEGAMRLFAGKENGDALVALADAKGRPRLMLKVDKTGAPSIELLDDKGKVAKRIGVE